MRFAAFLSLTPYAKRKPGNRAGREQMHTIQIIPIFIVGQGMCLVDAGTVGLHYDSHSENGPLSRMAVLAITPSN